MKEIIKKFVDLCLIAIKKFVDLNLVANCCRVIFTHALIGIILQVFFDYIDPHITPNELHNLVHFLKDALWSGLTWKTVREWYQLMSK